MHKYYGCDKPVSICFFYACKSMGFLCMKQLKKLFGKVFGTDEDVPFSTIVMTKIAIL